MTTEKFLELINDKLLEYIVSRDRNWFIQSLVSSSFFFYITRYTIVNRYTINISNRYKGNIYYRNRIQICVYKSNWLFQAISWQSWNFNGSVFFVLPGSILSVCVHLIPLLLLPGSIRNNNCVHLVPLLLLPGSIRNNNCVHLVALPVINHACHLPLVVRTEVHTTWTPGNTIYISWVTNC